MCSVMIVIFKPWQFYFFSNLNWFYIFLFSDCQGKTFKTKLNKSGKRGHSCLVPDFRGNAFSFSQLSMILAMGLSLYGLIMLKYVPSMLTFWRASIIIDIQFSSVAQLCMTLCDSLHHSMLGFPVYHQLPEVTQIHVHRVSDVIQPSHSLSSPSPYALNLSSIRVFSSEWVLPKELPKVAKVLEFPLQHESFQRLFRTDFL